MSMVAYTCSVAAPLASTFDGQSHPHAAPDAKTGEAFSCIAPDHFMQQGHQDPAAGGSDRMTDGDRSAIDVDLRGIPFHLAVDADRLRGKCFVDLHQVELLMS